MVLIKCKINKTNKKIQYTILSANLSNSVVGSAPGVNMNTKGDIQLEFSNDAVKSNGGGSINLLSKIDLSTNKILKEVTYLHKLQFYST